MIVQLLGIYSRLYNMSLVSGQLLPVNNIPNYSEKQNVHLFVLIPSKQSQFSLGSSFVSSEYSQIVICISLYCYCHSSFLKQGG